MDSSQGGRKVIEIPLRPNVELLDPEFETYKLDVRALPVIVQDFTVGVDTWELPRDFFSYQHVKAYGSHNHLFVDPWAPSSVYFFDTDRQVNRSTLVGQRQLESPRPVLTFTPRRCDEKRRVHAGLVFVSDRWVCVSDGGGKLVVAETGDRSTFASDVWETVYDGCPLGGEAPFLLSHAVLCDTVLHVALTRVLEAQEGEDANFCTMLDWITFSREDDGTCSLAQSRQLNLKDAPTFVQLAPDGAALYLCTESPPQLASDPRASPVDPQPVAPDFVWRQDAEEATVRLPVRQECGKDEVAVSIGAHRLAITVDGRLVVEGETEGTLDVEASTWTLQTEAEKRFLEVTLSKAEGSRHRWPALLASCSTPAVGQEELDPDVLAGLDNMTTDTEAVQQPPRGVDSLAQTEECDDTSERRDFFYRVDANTLVVSHRANLSSHQWLCAGGALFPGFCVRHDVDGLLWRLSHDETVLRHAGTFSALGYLWAAKAGELQFAGFAPDAGYAAYTALRRHVHVYRQPRALEKEMELRNRKSGRRVAAVARHHVVELKSQENVLGMVCTDEAILLLTRDQLAAVVV